MTGIAADLRTNVEVVLRSSLPVSKKRAILIRLSRQVEFLNDSPHPDGENPTFSLHDEEREDLRLLSRDMEEALARF